MVTDETLMPFGKYKGVKLANVPAAYLLWLFEEGKCYSKLKEYIQDNKEVLELERKQERIQKQEAIKAKRVS